MSRICSTTSGFASVVTSPTSRRLEIETSTRRMILPLRADLLRHMALQFVYQRGRILNSCLERHESADRLPFDVTRLTMTAASRRCSFDHLIRSRQHVQRNRESDLLGRFQVDHELKLRWLLHRQFAGVCTFQDLVYISGSAAVQVVNAHAVAHKPSVFHPLCRVIYRREPALYREVHNLFSVR